jgi:hypothetical protein
MVLLQVGALPNVHVFHAHDNISCVILEGTVECNNVLRVTIMHYAKFSDYSFADLILCFNVNHLEILSVNVSLAEVIKLKSYFSRHYHFGRCMLNFTDCTTVART